jgi:hypothetical protein
MSSKIQTKEINTMSKKDYIKLAEVLKSEKPQESWLNKYMQWELIVKAIATMCANDNPQFDYFRFYKACDYNPPANEQ